MNDPTAINLAALPDNEVAEAIRIRLVGQGITPSVTLLRRLDANWREWRRYCARHAISPVPITLTEIRCFLVEIVASGRKAPRIIEYLNSFEHFITASGRRVRWTPAYRKNFLNELTNLHMTPMAPLPPLVQLQREPKPRRIRKTKPKERRATPSEAVASDPSTGESSGKRRIETEFANGDSSPSLGEDELAQPPADPYELLGFFRVFICDIAGHVRAGDIRRESHGPAPALYAHSGSSEADSRTNRVKSDGVGIRPESRESSADSGPQCTEKSEYRPVEKPGPNHTENAVPTDVAEPIIPWPDSELRQRYIFAFGSFRSKIQDEVASSAEAIYRKRGPHLEHLLQYAAREVFHGQKELGGDLIRGCIRGAGGYELIQKNLKVELETLHLAFEPDEVPPKKLTLDTVGCLLQIAKQQGGSSAG